MRLKKIFLCLTALIAAHVPAQSYTATDGFLTEHFTFDPKLAPIQLEYVDFKIARNRTADQWGKDVGRYRFDLFGCRRTEKKLILNEGRVMRRDMKFFNVFFEELNELFPVVVTKDNPYYPYSIGDKEPAYLVTAEIKDLYVNACDHYDWRTQSYPRARSGTAEIKVLWRIMTPYDRKLYWEGETRGYADLKDPVRDGEVRLVEKAFADSLVRMTGMPGVIETLQNKPDEKAVAAAKNAYEQMKEEHIQNRLKQVSSYRRNRLFFYGEEERKPKFTSLEYLGRRFEQLAGAPLEPYRPYEPLYSSDTGDVIYGKLLKQLPLKRGVYVKMIKPSQKLVRLIEMTDTSVLDKVAVDTLIGGGLAQKFDFKVEQDGWITINNEKPFRYLTPSRIYRIRSSVTAVTGGGDVSSGVLIAPSLVLTNASAAKHAPDVKVEFLDGRIVPAFVLRVDDETDSALLYIPQERRSPDDWPVPLRLDLPDVGEKFYAVGTPMRGGYEGALEPGKVAGYRYTASGVDILTTTTVQSVTLGGVLVDESGNVVGLAHAGKTAYGEKDAFIPIGDAFNALRVRIRDRDMDETPVKKALRLREDRDYIK